MWSIWRSVEYGSLKPKKREGALDMDTTLFMADKVREGNPAEEVPPAAQASAADDEQVSCETHSMLTLTGNLAVSTIL